MPAPVVCILIPTYNNENTLEAVLKGVCNETADVIVVDDGCSDSSPSILKKFDQPHIITHPANKGKGAALYSGMQYAIEKGYTHIITMDSDGQHRPENIPRFVEMIRLHPDSLILGVRDLRGAGRPLKSRLLRLNSNLWTWVETGFWVADTQSGFRAYPVRFLNKFTPSTVKYDFEIEVLVWLSWMGVSIKSIPIEVRYNTGSHSHFRPLHDFALVAKLNSRLVFRRISSFITGRR